MPTNHPSRYGRRPARVLVEAADGAEAFSRLRLLQMAGYEVAWCPGPVRRAGRGCPLLDTGRCPMADDADIVVSALGLGQVATRQVLEAMGHHCPELPVVIETTIASADQFTPAVGCHRVITAPATPAALVSAVGEALAGLPDIVPPTV